MANLLYEKVKQEEIVPQLTRNGVTISEEEMCQLDDDFASLEEYTNSYISVSTVFEHLLDKPIDFLDSGNYVLYNEYIKNITKNLNVRSPVLLISQESLINMPSVAVNRKLALEGFVGDMWASIKAFFTRIYEGIKKFFSGIFTRMGRMKKKLINLESVLAKTDKNLKQVHLDKVPGGLSSMYPVEGNVTFEVVNEVFRNTVAGSKALVSVNNAAKKLANEDVLDSNFVAEIKGLRATAQQEAPKEDTGKDKDPKGDGKSMADVAKQAEPVGKESEAIAIGDKESNDGITNSDGDTEGEIKAMASFKAFTQELLKTLEPLKGKKLPKGKVISEIKAEEGSGLDITITTESGSPSGLDMGAKPELIKLIKESKGILDEVERVSKLYTEVNDTIFKNLDKIDRITKDIDAMKIESLGKYRAVLQKKVKVRLGLLKTFFKDYNEVNKNFFGMTVDAIEGNIQYTVTSLKYFGKE